MKKITNLDNKKPQEEVKKAFKGKLVLMIENDKGFEKSLLTFEVKLTKKIKELKKKIKNIKFLLKNHSKKVLKCFNCNKLGHFS